jgi:hypothetical protein
VLRSNTFKKILDLDLSVKRCRNQTSQSFWIFTTTSQF